MCRYAINRIGFGYDTKNIVDLMRFLIPLPVPQRWRRRMIAFGSGDPTKIICSALIAQAFDAVRYPILPKITRAASRKARREILHIRNSSLYMPRDFDISPYFEIVKPTIVHGFDYTALHWADKQKPLPEVAGEFGVFPEVKSPPLVPEEIDEEAPLPAEEVTIEEVTVETTMIERVTVSEHYLAVEYVPVRPPERRMKPRELVGVRQDRTDGEQSGRPVSPSTIPTIKTSPPASAAPPAALPDAHDGRRRRRSARPATATDSNIRSGWFSR